MIEKECPQCNSSHIENALLPSCLNDMKDFGYEGNRRAHQLGEVSSLVLCKISGEISVIEQNYGISLILSGKIPAIFSNLSKIARFEADRRKNYLYFSEIIMIFQFKRKFSVNFSTSLKRKV